MRPKKHETTGSADLFRARLDQIINMRHELVRLAGKIDWEFIDGEIAPLYSDGGRPGILRGASTKNNGVGGHRSPRSGVPFMDLRAASRYRSRARQWRWFDCLRQIHLR